MYIKLRGRPPPPHLEKHVDASAEKSEDVLVQNTNNIYIYIYNIYIYMCHGEQKCKKRACLSDCVGSLTFISFLYHICLNIKENWKIDGFIEGQTFTKHSK